MPFYFILKLAKLNRKEATAERWLYIIKTYGMILKMLNQQPVWMILVSAYAAHNSVRTEPNAILNFLCWTWKFGKTWIRNPVWIRLHIRPPHHHISLDFENGDCYHLVMFRLSSHPQKLIWNKLILRLNLNFNLLEGGEDGNRGMCFMCINSSRGLFTFDFAATHIIYIYKLQQLNGINNNIK